VSEISQFLSKVHRWDFTMVLASRFHEVSNGGSPNHLADSISVLLKPKPVTQKSPRFLREPEIRTVVVVVVAVFFRDLGVWNRPWTPGAGWWTLVPHPGRGFWWFFGSQKRPMDGHPIAMTYVTFVKTGATFLWLSEWIDSRKEAAFWTSKVK